MAKKRACALPGRPFFRGRRKNRVIPPSLAKKAGPGGGGHGFPTSANRSRPDALSVNSQSSGALNFLATRRDASAIAAFLLQPSARSVRSSSSLKMATLTTLSSGRGNTAQGSFLWDFGPPRPSRNAHSQNRVIGSFFAR